MIQAPEMKEAVLLLLYTARAALLDETALRNTNQAEPKAFCDDHTNPPAHWDASINSCFYLDPTWTAMTW